MADQEVSYARRGPLGVIRLERPDALNALTPGMISGVEQLARAAERDPEVIAICITGAGRGFCAGIDMAALTEHTRLGPPPARTAEDGKPARPALFSFLRDISKPVIAAINGVGAGGGFVLAMMCDLRFMAEDASLITIFSRRGLIAEHGTSWLLPRLVGASRALDLLWSSRRVHADEALRIGLLDRVFPADELLAGLVAYVDELAANVSPSAIAVMKSQVYRHLSDAMLPSLADADRLTQAQLKHPDALEGAMSLIERRPPRFQPWTGEAS